MKILIVSKMYYHRGGAEVVAIAEREMLRAAGHDVRVYAMQYPENLLLEESSSWAPRIQFGGSFGGNLRAFRRLMGWGDVRRSFRRVLAEARPDVVHFHNIHSYLSPVVVSLAHEFGARTIWTLHDLKLVCPAYLGRRPDGQLCTDCIDGERNLMKYRCMKGSRFASLMALLEAMQWNRRKLSAATDCFIAPSAFMKGMMERGGFDGSKIRILHNFIAPEKLQTILSTPYEPQEEPYFAYVGRLSAEKGVLTLVKAAVRAGVRLKIGGDGPLLAKLQTIAAGSKVEFLGRLSGEEVARLLRGAAAGVMPSECFENNPLAVIESLCAGTPVIGANIGGIPELIQPGVNGEHFPSGSVTTLAAKFATFNPDGYDRAEISRRAIAEFSEATHLDKLLKIYQLEA